MWTLTWCIKISKLCNLRCSYCYEWDSLASAARLSLSDWEPILGTIERAHRLRERFCGEPGRSYVVWHGGEPLLHRASYAGAVLDLQRRFLGAESLRRREYVNVIQTSLYSLHPDWLDLIIESGFEVAVSLDLVPGVRVARSGRGTEPRVIRNLDALRKADVSLVGAVVLARHTHVRLREIHDFFAERGIPFHVNPLIPSPAIEAENPLRITDGEATTALEDLFLHWIGSGCQVEVQPLSRYLGAVLLMRLGLSAREPPADPWGGRLVVELDGNLRRAGEIGAEAVLGNVFTDPTEAVLEAVLGPGARVGAETRRRRHCGRCDFRNACDGSPVLEAPRPYPPGPCPVAATVMAFIDRQLDLWAHDPFDELRESDWPVSFLGITHGGA